MKKFVASLIQGNGRTVKKAMKLMTLFEILRRFTRVLQLSYSYLTHFLLVLLHFAMLLKTS
jgi:hypothetical protein